MSLTRRGLRGQRSGLSPLTEQVFESRIVCDRLGASPEIREVAPFLRMSEATMSEQVSEAHAEEVSAEVIHVKGNAVDHVTAQTVRIHQGGANTVTGDTVELRQGGAIQITGREIELHQAIAFAMRGDRVHLSDSNAGVVAANDVSLNHSRAALIAGNELDTSESSCLVLLAREVHGDVETVLDTRGAMLAGIAAGVATGALLLVSALLRGRR